MLGVGGDTAFADPWHHDDHDKDRGCVVVQTPNTFVVVVFGTMGSAAGTTARRSRAAGTRRPE